MDIRKITGTVKEYAWGNDDFIPSLIGNYTGRPQAELWFGTHPSGESHAEDGSSLSSLIASDPSILGPEAYRRYSGRLPLLFKVLAIAKPLSLQCHPDKAQAEEGWKREEALRKEGKTCDYQDDNRKAEVIAALSPVTALPKLCEALRTAYVELAWTEGGESVASLVPEDELGLTLRLDGSGAPVAAEFTSRESGRTLITCRIDGFSLS